MDCGRKGKVSQRFFHLRVTTAKALEVSPCKLPARTGFRIVLECRSFLSVRERDGQNQFPRSELCRVSNFATVIPSKACFEMIRQTGIYLAGLGQTLTSINI